MRLEKLKDWDKLTSKEQARLRKVYGVAPEVTSTMHDTKSSSLVKSKKQSKEDDKNG